jgi:hypothetical protein
MTDHGFDLPDRQFQIIDIEPVTSGKKTRFLGVPLPLRSICKLPKPDGRNSHHLTAKPADIHLLDSTE